MRWCKGWPRAWRRRTGSCSPAATRPRPEAAAAIAEGPAIARVEGRVLDVRDPAAIAALAAELGDVDIVFSNATARMSPDGDPADEVDAVAETSNFATTASCGLSRRVCGPAAG